ncbi:MAG TPA: hypothetical protein VEA58_05405 [Anaerovoracaceae bacterium]|nr:hypothetical protein [Anaerovoracaceae bacterium]
MILSNDIESITDKLIRDYYPELKGIVIRVKLKKGKGFFMQTYLVPYFMYIFLGYRIEIHKSALKMSKESFIGCLGHELEHIAYQHTMRSGFFDASDQDERVIDQRLIDRGLGKNLFAFLKHHNSKYKKYKKKDGLTEKEVEKQLQVFNEAAKY